MNSTYAYNQQRNNDTIAAAHHAAQRYSVSLSDNRSMSVVQRKLNETLTSHASRKVFQFKANSTGLPDNLKTGIENLSGHSMDDVKVHYHSSKPAQLNAYAYAQGNQIHVAPGQEKHLAHEAWHVVQQKQGRVKPTMQMKGSVNVNDDTRLEHEADVMGAKAMSAAGFVAQRADSTGHVHYHYSPVAQLAHVTEISYQQGTLGWRGNNIVGPATHHQAVGIGTTAYLDPQDPEQGEVTGAAPAGSIYVAGGAHYAAQNGGVALTQGHLLNANLGGKAQPFNLFPITAEMNRAHSDIVEEPVKHMVLRVHRERTQEGSLGAAPFAPGGGHATGSARAASQASAAAGLMQVNAVSPAVGLAVNGLFPPPGAPPMALLGALIPVAGDNPAALAARIINAAAGLGGATAGSVAGIANAIAGPIGGAAGIALAANVAAANVAANAMASAAILVGAIGGGAANPAGILGTYTASPNDIHEAFRRTPGAGVAAAGVAPGGAAYNWDKVRVFYSVRVTSPGIKGNPAMRPNTLRDEEFRCMAAFTQQDGITPNLGLPHIDAVVRAPHSLNTDLAALGFGPTPPAGLIIGPAIASGGGAGGVGVLNAPSQHNITLGGAIVGHATLFNHG